LHGGNGHIGRVDITIKPVPNNNYGVIEAL